MKIDPEERILRCIEGEILDRCPHMELGFNPLPTFKFTAFLDFLPKKLRDWLLNLKGYEAAVQAAKEHLKLSKLAPKTWIRKAFFIDKIAESVISAPTSLEFISNVQDLTFYMPRRLGIDMITSWGFPSVIIRGKTRRNGKSYLVSEDYILVDIDEVGDIRGIGTFYTNFKRQIEKLIEIFKTYQLDDKIEFLKKTHESQKGKIAISPTFNGIFETWHVTFGQSNMHKFFRQLMKEYRQGPPYGIYKKLIQEKSNFFAKYIKRLGTETDIKIITIVEDIFDDNSPFIKEDIYKNYFVPEIKKVVDAAHKVGIKVLFHTDGTFKVEGAKNPYSFFDTILSTGIDMIHGCQQDVNDLADLKKHVENKNITLVGGISCVDVLQRAQTAREAYQMAGKAILTLKKNGRYIIAADNGWHAGVKIDNVKWYLKAIETYGKYKKK
ncbi:MAG: uroporphyrinogen decarboxylase family protein [Candidatus Helarchaeota archaeon]